MSESLIGKTVEWDFSCDAIYVEPVPVKGCGIVHSVIYGGDNHGHYGFIALVELSSGELHDIGMVASHMRVRKEAPDSIRWWVVALLPRRVALWLVDAVPLGSWAPYVWGQAMGVKGVEVSEPDAKGPNP